MVWLVNTAQDLQTIRLQESESQVGRTSHLTGNFLSSSCITSCRSFSIATVVAISILSLVFHRVCRGETVKQEQKH